MSQGIMLHQLIFGEKMLNVDLIQNADDVDVDVVE
jgi:hypothetical protein